jgi:hypothetical protein
MKDTLIRIAGIALVVAGIAGLVFCLVALVALGQIQDRVESTASEQLDVIDRALAATADGLALVENSLTQATSTVEALETTMADVGQAIGDTVPTIDSLADFLGEQLPATIGHTQETLRSAATSAQLVDDILGFITVIPLLGTDRYNPEVPLYQGLADVADSLDGIPNALGTAEQGIAAAGANLETLTGDFDQMAAEIGQVVASLEDAGPVLVQYQQVVADLQALVNTVRDGLPRWLGWLRLGLSLVLVWLGIAQVGLITQGWELVGRSRGPEADRG